MKIIATIIATALIVGGAFVWLDGDTDNNDVAAFGDNLIHLINNRGAAFDAAVKPRDPGEARSYTAQIVVPASAPNSHGSVGVGRVAIQAESFCREGYVCTGADHVAALSGVTASILNETVASTEALADVGSKDDVEDVQFKQVSAVAGSDKSLSAE